jgi:hypothetical protein
MFLFLRSKMVPLHLLRGLKDELMSLVEAKRKRAQSSGKERCQGSRYTTEYVFNYQVHHLIT